MSFREYLHSKKTRAILIYKRYKKKLVSKVNDTKDRLLLNLVNQKNNHKLSPNLESKEAMLDNISKGFDFEEDLIISGRFKNYNSKNNLELTTRVDSLIPEGSKVIRIIVRNGLIVEKEYITTLGEIIILNEDILNSNLNYGLDS